MQEGGDSAQSAFWIFSDLILDSKFSELYNRAWISTDAFAGSCCLASIRAPKHCRTRSHLGQWDHVLALWMCTPGHFLPKYIITTPPTSKVLTNTVNAETAGKPPPGNTFAITAICVAPDRFVFVAGTYIHDMI